MKESGKEHRRKAKQKMSALKGSQEERYQQKAKGSATTRNNAKHRRAHPLLLHNRRRKKIGHILQKDSKTVQRLISHTQFKPAAHFFPLIIYTQAVLSFPAKRGAVHGCRPPQQKCTSGDCRLLSLGKVSPIFRWRFPWGLWAGSQSPLAGV